MWSGTILAHLWESEWVWASIGSWHTLVYSAHAPSCLVTAHFPARNKRCRKTWILPPRYAEVGGKDAACPLTSIWPSKLQVSIRCSWCLFFAHILMPLDQVMGSPGLWWTWSCRHSPARACTSLGCSITVQWPLLFAVEGQLSRPPCAFVLSQLSATFK